MYDSPKAAHIQIIRTLDGMDVSSHFLNTRWDIARTLIFNGITNLLDPQQLEAARKCVAIYSSSFNSVRACLRIDSDTSNLRSDFDS